MNKSKVLKWMAVFAGTAALSCASSSATNTEPDAGTSNVEETQSDANTATAPGSTPVEDEATATTEVASAEEPATPTTEPASSETKKTTTSEATTASEDSEHVSVVELKLAKKISDRNPVDPGSEFSKGSKVYAWVKLNVTDSETQIKFQWFLDNSVVFTSDPVTVKQAPGWRSWRFKTVDATGTWKVAVLDVDDKVIHSQEFTVN